MVYWKKAQWPLKGIDQAGPVSCYTITAGIL